MTVNVLMIHFTSISCETSFYPKRTIYLIIFKNICDGHMNKNIRISIAIGQRGNCGKRLVQTANISLETEQLSEPCKWTSIRLLVTFLLTIS